MILCLISTPFMASGYCHKTELDRAIERHKADECAVVAILVSE